MDRSTVDAQNESTVVRPGNRSHGKDGRRTDFHEIESALEYFPKREPTKEERKTHEESTVRDDPAGRHPRDGRR